MKNILIACEYSGIVRTAFEKYENTNVWSCDLLETDIPTKKHYIGNVKEILYSIHCDLLIAFPPCTYLTSSGLYLCDIEKYGDKAIRRIRERNKAINFFLDLYESPIKHICIENPTGHINTNVLKHNQLINPYFFGERERKRTCLWLKNLPLLKHYKQDDLFNNKTHTLLPDPYSIDKTSNKNRYFTDCIKNNKILTAHERNKTFKSIADEMAKQWIDVI
jgi:hypothetical protein